MSAASMATAREGRSGSSAGWLGGHRDGAGVQGGPRAACVLIAHAGERSHGNTQETTMIPGATSAPSPTGTRWQEKGLNRQTDRQPFCRALVYVQAPLHR